MKIMKVIDKKMGDTTYYKYRINLPKELVEKLKLIGHEIDVRENKGRLIIEKRKV